MSLFYQAHVRVPTDLSLQYVFVVKGIFLSTFVSICHKTRCKQLGVFGSTCLMCQTGADSALVGVNTLLLEGNRKHQKLHINVFWHGLLPCFSSAAGEANCNISRPLSGLPLILSLVVLASKIVCFYTSPRLKSVRRALTSPICSSWL